MCLTPDVPKVTPTPPAPTQQDYSNTPDVLTAAANERARIAAMNGYQSTITTSPLGLASANPVAKKALLGS